MDSPTLSFFSVSSLSFSSFSAVSGSPRSPTGVTDVLWGGDVESAAGDVDLVLGALTAVESAADVAFEASDACDPVRSSEAARRGREADDEDVELGLRLMRAASWFNDGIRAPGAGRSGLGASTATSVVGADMVELVVSDDELSSLASLNVLFGGCRRRMGVSSLDLIKKMLCLESFKAVSPSTLQTFPPFRKGEGT